MRLPQVDWKRFLALLPQWVALSPRLRTDWIQMEPSARYRLVTGEGGQTLVTDGWLTPVDGDQYEMSRRRRSFHRALRAISRVAVFKGYRRGERQFLVDYLREHFSSREYATLGRSGATTDRAELAAEMNREEWLGDFLRWRRLEGRAEGAAERWRRASPPAVAAARGVIEQVIDRGAPMSLAEMLAVADSASRRSQFASGLTFGCREALLLVTLDTAALPYVGVWPTPGSTSAAGDAAPAPQFDSTTPLFCRPLLIDDMAALLVESTAVPPRLKADKLELFARARDAIAATLAALPAWIKTDDGPFTRDVRVDMAAYSARVLGLAAATGRRGKDLRLVVTERGRRWLTLDAGARLKQVLDVLRAPQRFSPAPENEYPYGSSPSAGSDSRIDDVGTVEQGLRFLPYDPDLEYPWFQHVDCRAAATDAFRSISGADAVSLADFVRRQGRERNPLAAIAAMPYVDEEDIERQWDSALHTFFNRRLVALGAVALGTLTDGLIGFRLTPVGRYLLAETDQLELVAPEESGDVLVQPNFEIVFLAPSLDAQLHARAYAEPTAALQGADSVGTLFVLRRESVQRAVMAGQNAERIVASLRELSKHRLPDNVERQVTEWAGEVRWIDVRPAVVVDCGDAETAARVLTVVGKGGRQLSATAVELLAADNLKPAVRKKLMTGGIFVRS